MPRIYRTGLKKYSLLVERNVITGELTGRVKPNDPSDPDYVAPVTDTTACPIGVVPTPSPMIVSSPTTTTSTTTTLRQDALRIHVGYKYSVQPGVPTGDAEIDLQVKIGTFSLFHKDVLFAEGNSDNRVIAIVGSGSSRGLINILIPDHSDTVNWMKVLYSTNSYPNIDLGVGTVLFQGPIGNVAGLSIPSNKDGSVDILVIQFETVPA